MKRKRKTKYYKILIVSLSIFTRKMMNTNTLLQIENLSFGYNKHNMTIQNANFKIERGDYISAIGPNGGGKTTLIKLILGLLKKSSGNIIFNKNIIKNKTDIGYVPQFMLFDRDFPVKVIDIVLMGFIGKLFKPYSKQNKKDAHHALDKLNILKYKDKYISELSGGEIQKVLIARAMAPRPRLLLLDEPTNFVDEETTESLFSMLKGWNPNTSILLSTHDVGVVSKLSSKILCINKSVHLHTDYKESYKRLKEIYEEPIELISHNIEKHE